MSREWEREGKFFSKGAKGCVFEGFQSHISHSGNARNRERRNVDHRLAFYSREMPLVRFKFPQGTNDNIFSNQGDDLYFCMCVGAKQIFNRSGHLLSL